LMGLMGARPTAIDQMFIPPVAYGVKVVSMEMFKPERADAVAYRGPLLHRVLEQLLSDAHWGDLDLLLLDLPPGTGDLAISLAQLIPTSEIIVVTTPQVAAAEVASAASNQGLSSGVLSSEELSKYGVDLETARKGYATIADILPTASKLGEIYKEEGISYNQGTAEQETFKGLASAQRKRQRLAEKEIGAFGGRSGLTSASLGKTLSGLI
jgi:hypothetical protein